MAKEIKVRFAFERSTKGAHRYQEIDAKGNVIDKLEDTVIGTLYIRKSALGDTPTTNLEVNIVGK